MAQEPQIYIIDPEETDPGLIRNMTALGEVETRPSPRRQPAVRRARPAEPRTVSDRPPSRPMLLLVGAYLGGPLFLLTSRAARRRRASWFAALSPVLALAAAITLWWRAEAVLGPRESTFLVQVAVLFVAGLAWLAVWAAGLLRAGRACKEGPLARRGQRRPLAAGSLGILAPGLGLLLAGRPGRCVLSLALVGIGGLAAVVLSRATTLWTWHRETTDPLLSSLHLEAAFLGLGAMVGIGLLTWLVSAIDGLRLASRPTVIRSKGGPDRIALALLTALIAFAICFRPLAVARELDRTSGELAVGGMLLIPLWTARAATMLAPSEPRFALRLADFHAALGQDVAAAAIRSDLAGRWQEYARLVAPVAPPAASPPDSDQFAPHWQTVDRGALLPLSPGHSGATTRPLK